MVFSSLEFLFLFLPVSFILYFLVPRKYIHIKNLVLLIVSLVFYGWSEPIYVFLMVFTILIDYIFGILVAKYLDTNKKKSKTFLVLSIVSNISILFFFKYYDFLVGLINQLLALCGISSLIPLLNLELPIGISFYTFQALSYVIDIYRGEARVQKNAASFGAYVTLFPQLIAGPIVRYQDVDDMLRERNENVTLFASGVRTFSCGLAKKVLLGNIAGELWTNYSSMAIADRSVFGSWIGIIFYMFQIYFDFSGYSDMAIGLGKMFGFKFLENFNYPYISKSITEFWRRWHMSLSTWFREYVYFPLGGSRNDKKWKTYRNLFVVWLLTGLWHGASLNFVLWGLYYFVILVLEKLFLGKVLEKIPGFISHIYSLIVILFGWLIFVFEDFNQGLTYFCGMFGSGTSSIITNTDIYDLVRIIPFAIILVIACTPFPKKIFYKFYEKSNLWRIIAAICSIAIIVLCVAYLVDSSFNPFLYFRF